MKTLAEIQIGEKVYIKNIQLEQPHKQRLQALGLNKKTFVTVLASSKWDKSILLQNGSKIILGQDINRNIFVE